MVFEGTGQEAAPRGHPAGLRTAQHAAEFSEAEALGADMRDAELLGGDAGKASTRAKRRKAERADRAALEDLKKRAPGVRVTPPPGARD